MAGHTGAELELSPPCWFLLIQLLVSSGRNSCISVKQQNGLNLLHWRAQKHPCELLYLPFTVVLSSAAPGWVDVGP